jgi:hypothetical protein
MQRPHKKKINKITPVLLCKPTQQYLEQFQDDYYDKPRKCPNCKSSNRKKLTVEEKLFCIVIVKGKFKRITIFALRFQCKDCGKTYYAKAPFYDQIMYCKPIVDLILYLAAKNPFHRIETKLLEYGIQVDEDTCKNYAKKFQDKVKKHAKITIFEKDVGINMIKVMFGVKDAKQLKSKYPHKKFDSVSDETYPTIKGAKKKFDEINRWRKLRGQEPFKYPNGWTLAVSYLAMLKLFASIVITPTSFNRMFADALMEPLNGSDYDLTDGSPCYKSGNHERCLFHKSRNLAKKDKVLKKMKKDKKPPDEIKQYLKDKYKELKERYLKELKEKYPRFVVNGNFIGATTTNAMEGGNWRLKYELRTSYSNQDAITGRIILACLLDSIYTFRNGMPDESFAHKHTTFSFGKIMAC